MKTKQHKKRKPKPTSRRHVPEPKNGVLSPEEVHALFDLPGPYEPPPRPLDVKGYVTFWDPGLSIAELRRRHHFLFAPTDMSESLRYLKESDAARWKHIRLDPIEPGATFDVQRKKMAFGEPAAAREVVTFLLLHFLVTGERIEMDRLRCRDLVPSGRRVIVGPFPVFGVSLGSVGDHWKSPSVGLSSILIPKRKK